MNGHFTSDFEKHKMIYHSRTLQLILTFYTGKKVFPSFSLTSALDFWICLFSLLSNDFLWCLTIDSLWFPMNSCDFRLISWWFLWFPLISHDFFCFPIISYDSLCFYSISCDFLWLRMFSYAFQWFLMIPCDFKCFLMISYDFSVISYDCLCFPMISFDS